MTDQDDDQSAALQPSGSSSTRVPHSANTFNDSYAESGPRPPWDIGRPQPAFLRLASAGGLAGAVLDVGCGTGEHALMASALGHDAVGVDIAPRAIEQATAKAESRGSAATFLVLDALQLHSLQRQFDTVLDCGLFHCFEDEDRPVFVNELAHAVRPGGQYHMLCFSDRQPGDWGPRRVSEAEIRASFGGDWTMEAIDEAVIDITIDPQGAKAWLVTATRLR